MVSWVRDLFLIELNLDYFGTNGICSTILDEAKWIREGQSIIAPDRIRSV